MENADMKLTFTVTTCRRLRSFITTMDSFFDTCLDIDLFDRFICYDDHSTDEDVAEMLRRYPFLEIHSSTQRGQWNSLNNLFAMVQTKWFFHCEDDWLFVNRDNYIRKMMDVAAQDTRFRNVGLRDWVGLPRHHTMVSNVPYTIHEYAPTKDHQLMLRTDCNWYGYSLNPGLQHKPTLEQLGPYYPPVQDNPKYARYWDRPIAEKYRLMGYLRANLADHYIEHIGEVSSYDL